VQIRNKIFLKTLELDHDSDPEFFTIILPFQDMRHL